MESPKYTRENKIVHDTFKSFSAIEGSEMTLSLKSNKKVKAVLTMNDQTYELAETSKNNFSTTLILNKGTDYSVKITDEKGNYFETPKYRIDIVQDMPPTIEVLEPGRDVKRQDFETVNLKAAIFDDYGISDVVLHMHFSSGGNEKEVLFKAKEKVETEKEVRYVFDIKDLAMNSGDVLTYFLTARDNKTPEGQVTRSKVYFIQVRPDPSIYEQEQQQQQQQQQQQNMNVADLSAEQRKIIRETLDAIYKTPTNKETGAKDFKKEDLQKISAALGALSVAAAKRLKDVKEKAQGADLGAVEKFMKEAIKNMKQGEELARSGSLQQSLNASQRSASALNKVEMELEKNQVRSKSKSKQQNQAQNQNNKKNQQKKKEDEEKKKERIADMLDEAEELMKKQREAQKNMEDLKNPSDREKKELEEELKDLEKKQEQLGKQMENMQETQQASESMKQAGKESGKAGKESGQGNTEQAKKHNNEAMRNMQRSKQQLRDALRNLTTKDLQKLANAAKKLQDNQSKLRNDTEKAGSKPSDKVAKDLKARQQQNTKELENIINKMGKLSTQMEEKYPQVAESIRKAREKTSQNGTSGRMKRAANALHYGRTSRAVQSRPSSCRQ